MQVTEIITDDTLRETRTHGSSDFQFEYYFDDIKKFNKQYVEWHWHNEIEIIFVDRGPIDCLIGNERIRIHAGDGMFINSGIIHRFESPATGHMPNILFTPEFIAPSSSLVYKKYVYPIISSNCSYVLLKSDVAWQADILNTLRRIYEEAQTRGLMRELTLQTLVCSMWSELFVQIQSSLSQRNAEGNIFIQPRLQMMLQFISEEYSRKISLEDIAASANISKSEALRCFHFGVQTTPVNYLIEYRLNRAREALSTTKNTVTAVALSTGFDNVGYFCRLFKKTYGISPKAFQKQ